MQHTILTGLRPNNNLHLGNYFGALLPIVDLAKSKTDESIVNLMVADLHAFVTPIDHSVLNDQIQQTIKLFVAARLPLHDNSVRLFRQSYIPAHSELTWILNNFTGVGEMERMTQFKDKSSKLGKERINLGLLDYPVLQAVDILLYSTNYVPVGDDQTQHLEFTRDIAERMNNRFGNLFTVPESVAKQHEFFGNDQGLRIKDLVNPSKKMSKSDDTGKGVIFLSDDPEIAAKKIMSTTTDDKGSVQLDRENQPGISNLLEILALLRGQAVEKAAAEFAGETRYGDFKKVVADEVKAFLTDFQNKLANVDEASVLAKLESSEKLMNEQANATLLKVQQAVGLRPRG